LTAKAVQYEISQAECASQDVVYSHSQSRNGVHIVVHPRKVIPITRALHRRYRVHLSIAGLLPRGLRCVANSL